MTHMLKSDMNDNSYSNVAYHTPYKWLQNNRVGMLDYPTFGLSIWQRTSIESI